MIRTALVAALVGTLVTLAECGGPPSNDGTSCPRPEPAVYFAGQGEVIDKQSSAHPGCEPQWFLKVREDSSGREVWMKVADTIYSDCDRGRTWQPRFLQPSGCT